MNINLNRKSGEPLYIQIYNQVVNRIDSGLLTDGQLFPSIRVLSKRLGVSFLTVNKAYKMLEDHGYLEILHGKGAYIKQQNRKDKLASQAVSKRVTSPFDWQLSIPNYLSRSQFHKYNQLPVHYNFSMSTIYSRLLPTRFLASELTKMIEREPSILGTYGSVQGDEELRQEIAHYVNQHNGLNIHQDNMIITTGLQQAIELIIRTFIGPGDVVLTEAPTYTGAIDVFYNHGARVIPIPVDHDGMRTDLLERVCHQYSPKIIYVNPTFQNPTGTVMSERRRLEVLELARTVGAIIVEDDSWNEIYFDDRQPPPTIKSYDDEGVVIYLKGFSKALAPGIRIGAIISHGSFQQVLLSAKASMDLGTPLLLQKAILPFIQSKRMSNHLMKLRVALELRRDKVMDILESYIGSRVSWIPPRGGLNLWLTLPEHVNTNDLLLEANKHSISFLPGSACYPSEPPQNHIRLTYSLLSDTILEEGVHQFGRLLQKFLAY